MNGLGTESHRPAGEVGQINIDINNNTEYHQLYPLKLKHASAKRQGINLCLSTQGNSNLQRNRCAHLQNVIRIRCSAYQTSWHIQHPGMFADLQNHVSGFSK